MLPLSAPSRNRDNGLRNIKTVNQKVVLSLIWAIASIIVIVFGFWHCRANAYNYQLQCDADQCNFVYPSNFELDDSTPLIILKEDLKFADDVTIDEETIKIIDTIGMKSRKVNKMPKSVAIKYDVYADETRNPDSKELRTLVFQPVNIGRRKARSQARKIKDYLNVNEDTVEGINMGHGKFVTAVGIVSIVLGIVSLILSFALGSWKDEQLDRMRKNIMKGRRRRD